MQKLHKYGRRVRGSHGARVASGERVARGERVAHGARVARGECGRFNAAITSKVVFTSKCEADEQVHRNWDAREKF